MIWDVEKKCCISQNPFFARQWIHRLRGMIGRKFHPETLDAMVFMNCNSIHNMWMTIPLDILFLDCSQTVAALRENYRPWSFPAFCRQAETVIELPAGTISRFHIETGDHLDLNADLSKKYLKI